MNAEIVSLNAELVALRKKQKDSKVGSDGKLRSQKKDLEALKKELRTSQLKLDEQETDCNNLPYQLEENEIELSKLKKNWLMIATNSYQN